MVAPSIPLRSCGGAILASSLGPDGRRLLLGELTAEVTALLELSSTAAIPADCFSLTPQFLQKLSTGSTCEPHWMQTIKTSLLRRFCQTTSTGRICQLAVEH